MEQAFAGYPFAMQAEQLGTGHAVACAQEAVGDYDGPVLVCCGDMPLMRERTYRAMFEAQEKEGNVCTILAPFARRICPMAAFAPRRRHL